MVPTGSAAQVQSPEIVVTGERQVRTREQTASSVAVYSSADIDAASGAHDVEQMLALVPNVALGSGGEGPTIRGQDTTGVLRDLPAFLGGTRPRTTMQVDGRTVTYNEFAFGVAPLWDVARIEVFRSPQTTTQGTNSIAGAIFVETADPTFHWEARARVSAGSERSRQASGVVSGPLIPEQVAARLSVDARHSVSSSVLTSAAAGIDPNREDYGQVRLKALVQPAPVPGLRVMATFALTRSQAPQIEGVRAPFELRRDPNATYGVFKTDVTSLTVRVEQRLTPALSITATGSWGDSFVRRFAPAGFGETQISAVDRSLELVSEWKPGPAIHITAGVHFSSNDLAQAIDLSAARLGRGQFSDRQQSLGLFGEATAEPFERFEITAGARYQKDDQVRSGVLGMGLLDSRLSYDGKFEAFLPKLSVNYRVGDESRIGVLVQRAYNPGGTTLSLSTLTADTFDAEWLWDYEAFARASLFGRKLTLLANVFNYQMRNAQRSLLRELQSPQGTVFFADTANAPSARSRGAELELVWKSTSHLTIQGGVGLLATRLTGALSTSDPLYRKEFQRSPHASASIAAIWRPAEHLMLSSQMRYHSHYFSDDSNDPARRIGPAAAVDARAEWSNGMFRLFGYLRNVFDTFALTYLFTPASHLATASEPREFGLGIEAQF
jgi:outer membrane receptor protein involved in Fe transport